VVSIEKQVVSILCEQLGIPEDRITPDLFIIGEVDSPDHVELIMELEAEFDITIPDRDAVEIQTLAQAVRYVEGRLADVAQLVIARR
jgi:acyl carrier protein